MNEPKFKIGEMIVEKGFVCTWIIGRIKEVDGKYLYQDSSNRQDFVPELDIEYPIKVTENNEASHA